MIICNLMINNTAKGRLNKIDQLLDSSHDIIQLRNRNQTTDELPTDSFFLQESKNVYCMLCTLQKFSFQFCSADNTVDSCCVFQHVLEEVHVLMDHHPVVSTDQDPWLMLGQGLWVSSLVLKIW